MQQSAKLFNVAQIRAIEQQAINHQHIEEAKLMERAGLAAWQAIKQAYPHCHQLAVVCGSGNNGGDGFVVARLASLNGVSVTVLHTREISQLSPLNQSMALQARNAGAHLQVLDEDSLGDIEACVIVDALLGIGISGEVTGFYADVIEWMNQSALELESAIVAIDCPSGLDCNKGLALGACVNAAITMTFIGVKQGLVSGDGLNYSGVIRCDDLGLADLLKSSDFESHSLVSTTLIDCLKPRRPNSHKRHFGHVLIIGGGSGMPGAVCLAAQASLRCGAGLVSVATSPEHASLIPIYQPEIISHGIETAEQIHTLLEQATVCVIGPGLGTDNWAQQLFKQALACQLPMVIDASALHLLAQVAQHDDNWVLTPHPGEAAVMLQCESSDIQQDRFSAARQLQTEYGGTVVLKGAGTLIASADAMACFPQANPAMSSAGMGDALTGIIAALIAQGMSLEHAAQNGVAIHATAGNTAAKQKHSILATDLIKTL